VALPLASVLLSSACALTPIAEDVPVGRLPADVRPIAYRLELEVDPRRERFEGAVEIDVELDRARRVVWLHAQDLDVDRVSVTGPGGQSVRARFEPAGDTGVAALRFADPVGPGRLALSLGWSAPFVAGLRGLYRVERQGAAYAFTQMEPIDARRVLPSFDEPAFKVPFDVSLVVPEGMAALANTPEVSREALPGERVRHRYAPTPPIPTYLLAWAVGPLDVVDAPPIPPNAIRERPVPLRGVAPRGRGGELAFALASTPAILEAVERYVGSAYPFAKLDLVAVPDFSAGAMENVGLVTFRDSLLLIDPSTASVHRERAFANVMAHELAHMWFGNLVTMPWWDDIWLNEAFATWLAGKTVAGLYPDHRSDLAELQATHGAMNADSLASARAIRQPIASNHDIRNAFDGITYRKGAAVLAMFEAAVGEEGFRETVQRYLARHADSTATSADFLAALSEVEGEESATAMGSFLDRPGLPLLAFESECLPAADAPEGRFQWSVTQSRYRPLGSTLSSTGEWALPVCGAGGACPLLTGPRGVFEQVGCPRGFHPNPGATGYYRWTLPPDEWERLIEEGWPGLSERERMSVADALRAGYRAGSVGVDQVMAVSRRLAADPARPVATAPFGMLRELRDRLAATPQQRERAEALVRELYAERARALGFDAAAEDDGERRLLRGQLVGVVVGLGRAPALRAEARRRGGRYLAGPPGLPDTQAAAAELRGAVAAVAVEDGGRAEFDAALAHLFATEDAAVRGQMLRAVASARDPERAERARQLVFDPRLRANERLRVISAQARNAESPREREEVFEWTLQHADRIVEVISPAQGAGLLGAAAGFCSPEAAARVRAAFAERIDSYPGGPRRLEGLVERIELCAARVAQQRPSARAVLAPREAL